MTISRNDFNDELNSAINWDVYSHQQDPTPQTTPKSSPKAPSSFSMKDDMMAAADKINQFGDKYIGAPLMGVAQGVANAVPAGLNLGKHLIENITSQKQMNQALGAKDLPDVPYFDVAPHTLPAQAGEAASLVAGGGRQVAEGLEKGAAYVGGKAKQAYDYLHPSTAAKQAEEFRSTIGQGTSKQNIEELSRRAKLAKQSAKQEALIPKEQLYSQEGKSDVYKVDPSQLPEGNIKQVAGMFDEGGRFDESQIKSLQKALSDYRKGKVDKDIGGEPIESFIHKAEDIFNVPELSDKHIDKIEDALSLPTSRKSKYFGDEDVDSVYSKNGKLRELHDQYKDNSTLANYDALQSALKKEQRKLKPQAVNSDTADAKLDQINANIKNLDSDKENFMQTLPEKMQNLENEFRQKYQSYASTYEKPAPGKKDIGSSITLRRLAEGKHDLVTDAQVQKVFANPTAADKKIILDMGPSAGRNALYAAMQRVQPGDAENMAKTILDLKRTKGFDNIVTKSMEDWANNMLAYTSRAERIRRRLSVGGNMAATGAGTLAGGLLGGPAGAVIGAGLPHAAKVGKYLVEKLRK